MKITSIFADKNEETHLDYHEENVVETRNHADYTRAIAAYGLVFKESKQLGAEPALGGWHTAPQRQYVLFVIGETEIEVSDGEKRIVRAGDVLLVEVTTGKGHRNRRLRPEPELWAFVRSR